MPEKTPLGGKKPAPQDDGAAEKSDEALKREILALALPDAAFDGFTPAMLEKAGMAAGLDQAGLARLFPDGPLSLIAFYSQDTDRRMEEHLTEMDLAALKVRARIKAAVKTRLELLAPHKEAARRAAAILSLPLNAALAARLLYRSVDAMWRAVGDTSTDFNFYTKRAILAVVYGGTTMRWFNDSSADGHLTDAFLDARIENVMQFEKFKAEAKKAIADFPPFRYWTKPKTE